MPDPLRFGLAAAPTEELFTEITGQHADRLVQICETTAADRLPLLMLGPIVTAYERAMTEGEGKNTWRTDRYAPCPRDEAGAYLAFLASTGYRLSVIEQALVDDTPYTGDTPAAEPPAGGDHPARAGGQPQLGEPAIDGADSVRDGDPADSHGTAGQAAA
jgi:hypothetical protein